jgi:hypothetical protein
MNISPARFLPSALLSLVALLFAGCASDTKVVQAQTAAGVTAIKGTKVFVLGMNPDNTNRRMAEVAVRDVITKYPVVCSFEPLPDIEDIKVKDKVVKAVQDSGADVFIVLRLLNKDQDITYSTASAMSMGYEYYYTDSSMPANSAVPFYQNSGNVYTNRIFTIEAAIYDVKARKLLWKGATKTTKSAVDVGDLNGLITEVALAVRSKLQSEDLIK